MKQPSLIKVCSHFASCAGCVQQPGSYPLIWEEVIQFFKDFDGTLQLHQGNAEGWRHRAKIAVRGPLLEPKLGLFKRHSHEVISIPNCVVHHPKLNEAFEKVKQWMMTYRLKPYQEKEHVGDIRYIQGVVERETQQVQLVLVINHSGKEKQLIDKWKAFVNHLWETYPNFWHSIWINWNNKKTNTIFSDQWTLINGQELLWECFDGRLICYHPASFGQANLDLFEKLIIKIKQMIPLQSRVTEFYAGTGVIGLCLVSQCEWVRCSEMNPAGQICFDISKSRLDQETAAKISYETATTENTLELMYDATHVIVDPPRKGLDPAFFQSIEVNKTVQNLIYISCGWEAFQRDCLQLQELGWKITSMDGYLFFPGSAHIELLVHFKRI